MERGCLAVPKPMKDPKRRVRAIVRLVDRWDRALQEEDSIIRLLRRMWSMVWLIRAADEALVAIPREERLSMIRNDSDPWLGQAFMERLAARRWKELKGLDEKLDDPEINSLDWISYMWQAILTRRLIRNAEEALRDVRK